MKQHQVKVLLMGGQACVLYGGAEFSRDIDLAILVEPKNIAHLKQALAELEAECIAVPPFKLDYLERGHAVHFRCKRKDLGNVRLDLMANMRGVDSFTDLWGRRTTIENLEDTNVDLISLPDLVKSKKTQRDKDWPMIRRLLEAHYLKNREENTVEQVVFWLSELRTPTLLIEVAKNHSSVLAEVVRKRSLLEFAKEAQEDKLAEALELEEKHERIQDKEYWAPLKKELESLRHQRSS